MPKPSKAPPAKRAKKDEDAPAPAAAAAAPAPPKPATAAAAAAAPTAYTAGALGSFLKTGKSLGSAVPVIPAADSGDEDDSDADSDVSEDERLLAMRVMQADQDGEFDDWTRRYAPDSDDDDDGMGGDDEDDADEVRNTHPRSRTRFRLQALQRTITPRRPLAFCCAGRWHR